MKQNVYWSVVIFFSLWLLACVNREKNETHATLLDSVPSQDTRDTTPLWTYDYEGDSVLYVGRAESEPLSLEELVQLINERYKHKVRVNLLEQKDDTIFVKIDSATVLTQQMGSAGARDFMAVATFTLTEAEGVDYVFFDFEEGDHAAPGLYSRQHFQSK